MTTAAEVCERLAALLRAGHGPRAALTRLPERMNDAPDAAVRTSRLAALGVPIDLCLRPLLEHYRGDLEALAPALTSMGPSGSDSARSLDRLAQILRKKDALRRDAAVAAAGATMSARTIAALPLLTIPVALRQLDDPIVVVALGAGVALWTAGYRWLMRIVPRPEDDPPDALIAEDVVVALGGGQSLDRALRRAAVGRGSRAIVRRFDLGGSWRLALSADHPRLATAIGAALALGVPVAEALWCFADEERAAAAQRFRAAVGRAPVKMVVPLACCVLPSFVLVGIVPLLRGLALPG